MLRDSNGKPYQLTGSIAQFDPENPDHDLINLWDQEQIELGGTPIFYYEVHIQRQGIDPLYREDRTKIFSPCPVQLYGLYEPIPSQNFMNMFGLDGPDEMQFEFNYRAVLKAIGHPPKIGSRLFTPHLRENWQIIQRNLGEFKFWGALRLTIIAQRFQESTTTGEGRVSQKEPSFKLNEGALLK